MAGKLVIEQLRKVGAAASINQLKEVLTELAKTWAAYSFAEKEE